MECSVLPRAWTSLARLSGSLLCQQFQRQLAGTSRFWKWAAITVEWTSCNSRSQSLRHQQNKSQSKNGGNTPRSKGNKGRKGGGKASPLSCTSSTTCSSRMERWSGRCGMAHATYARPLVRTHSSTRTLTRTLGRTRVRHHVHLHSSPHVRSPRSLSFTRLYKKMKNNIIRDNIIQ